MIRSPFNIHNPVIPPIFAGREKELSFIQEAILLDKENVIIHGIDGIGKSSVIKTLFHSINDTSSNKVLAVEIDVTDFLTALENNFLNIITHKICSVIWMDLMNRKYSELLEDTLLNVRTSKSSKFKAEEKNLKRIFKIITSSTLSGKGRIDKEFGGKFYVEGKIAQSNELEYHRKPLESFEFLALLKELYDIIKAYGYHSIMVFCDELNHLPKELNIDLFRSYLKVFTSNQIQFIVVSINPTSEQSNTDYDFIEAFNYQLKISPYDSVDNVTELLNNCLKDDAKHVTFDEGIPNLLFDAFSGNPWWIQKACDSTYKSAIAKESEIITEAMILAAVENFKKDFEFYQELTGQGKPFRKTYLRYKI